MERQKKYKKPKDMGHFLACCHVAYAFLSTLELIWPTSISRLKISKLSKNVFLVKSSGSQWLTGKNCILQKKPS